MILSQGFSLVSSSFESPEASQKNISSITPTETLIISDEIDLRSAPKEETVSIKEDVNSLALISDEAPLESFDIEQSAEVASLMSHTEKSYIIAQNISDEDVFQLFIKNKSRFQGTGNKASNYEDFINTWKTLSQEYHTKDQEKILSQKAAFVKVYLDLS